MTKAVLHLCASFRRKGGIGDFVYAFNGHNNVQLLIIPIDIVSDNSRHKILDPDDFRHYLALFPSGHGIGVLAGPLCET